MGLAFFRRARQRQAEARAEAPKAEPKPKPAPATVPPTPEVKAAHRGSGRWSAEIGGKPLKDAESGDVALFDSREAAQAAGESFVRAQRGEG